MNRELDELLCQRYPSIFRDRHAPMTDTCMCWGFACGDGWYALIDTLCAEIQQYVDALGIAEVVASQVKEKFGCLRFYVRSGNVHISAMTWFADYLSGFICEECGAPALRTGSSWIQTRCARHGGEDFPLDAPTRAESDEELLCPEWLPANKHAAWARAAAFHLPPVRTRGWRHIATALEHTIRNDLRHNELPAVVITNVTESDALRYRWAGGDTRGWLAAMVRLAEAYSARSDRQTGAAAY